MITPLKALKPDAEILPEDAPVIANRSPSYLTPIVQVIEENWELPAQEQFDHACRQFLEELLQPIEQMEDEFADRQLELISHVQAMVQIAPDLFDKAMRRTPYETGYLIKGDDDHA